MMDSHLRRRSSSALSNRYRLLLLAIVLLFSPTLGAQTIDQQIRQVEAALAAISQEQQALYQQFNMVQELRRNEERQLLVPGPPLTVNYDERVREDQARSQRIRDYMSQLDQLYARHRE